MEHWIAIIRDWLVLHQSWLIVAIIVTAFVESLAILGLIVPAMALMFAIGTLAGGSGMSVWVLLGCAWLGAVLGDCLSFALGKSLRERIHQIWPFSRYPIILDRGEHYFQRHGGKSVILGRFIGPLRPVMPLVAGALDMHARRFVVYEIVAAAGWSPTYVLPGFLVGASMALHLTLPQHFYPIVLTSLALLLTIYFLFVRLHWAMDDDRRFYRGLRAWLRRYDTSHRFWRAVSSQRPEGGEFPLPSLVLLLVSLAGFTLWTMLTLHTHWLGGLDRAAEQFFLTLRSPLLDPLFLGLTLIADTPALVLSFTLFVVLLWIRDYRPAALHVALAGLAAAALIHGFKIWFEVPRPLLVMSPPGTPAYPSGHSCGITTFLGLMAAFVAREWPWRRRWQIYIYFSLPMFLVSLSRVYLGVHWFTDVIGGILLGLAICGATRVAYSRFDRKALTLNGTTWWFLGCWVIVMATYIYWRWPAATAAYRLSTTG